MLGPFATTSCLTSIHQMLLVVLSRVASHRCPRQRQRRQRRRQRQRVTEGTAVAPWNGPNQRPINVCVIPHGMQAPLSGAGVSSTNYYAALIYILPSTDRDSVSGEEQTCTGPRNHALYGSTYGCQQANTIKRCVRGGDVGCRYHHSTTCLVKLEFHGTSFPRNIFVSVTDIIARILRNEIMPVVDFGQRHDTQQTNQVSAWQAGRGSRPTRRNIRENPREDFGVVEFKLYRCGGRRLVSWRARRRHGRSRVTVNQRC